MKVEILVFSFSNENREKNLGFGKTKRKGKIFQSVFLIFLL